MKEYFNGFSTQDLVDMRRNDEKRKEKVEMEKEIERLNNIINGMEKYLWEERYNHHGEYVISGRKAEDIYTLILDKLQELKGVDKE